MNRRAKCAAKGKLSQVSDLMLVGAVIVHRPDFFVAAAAADKVNLALGDAVNAAAQAENNFIGKFVRDGARRRRAWRRP